MAIPTEQQVQISGTPTEGNDLIQDQWVKSGVDVTVMGSGIKVSNGEIYLTDGSAHKIGDASCAFDSPNTSNSVFIINKNTNYYIGYTTDDSTPDYPYIKVAEATPSADTLNLFNGQRPPISSSKIDADSLSVGGGMPIESLEGVGGGGEFKSTRFAFNGTDGSIVLSDGDRVNLPVAQQGENELDFVSEDNGTIALSLANSPTMVVVGVNLVIASQSGDAVPGGDEFQLYFQPSPQESGPVDTSFRKVESGGETMVHVSSYIVTTIGADTTMEVNLYGNVTNPVIPMQATIEVAALQ